MIGKFEFYTINSIDRSPPGEAYNTGVGLEMFSYETQTFITIFTIGRHSSFEKFNSISIVG
jgi:hypothetical protein